MLPETVIKKKKHTFRTYISLLWIASKETHTRAWHLRWQAMLLWSHHISATGTSLICLSLLVLFRLRRTKQSWGQCPHWYPLIRHGSTKTLQDIRFRGGGAQKRHLKYRGTKISHLGNRTIIFKSAIGCGYVSSQEGKSQDSYHLLSFRAHATHRIPSRELLKGFAKLHVFQRNFHSVTRGHKELLWAKRAAERWDLKTVFLQSAPDGKMSNSNQKNKKKRVFPRWILMFFS